jgi:phi13 family phage major tail protein
MAVANRPRFGAKDLVYAVLSEPTDVEGGTPTFGAIKALAGLGKIAVNPNASQATLYGDDQLQHIADTIGKVDVSFDLADILPDAYAEVLGHTYANGQIMEKATDQSPYIAIGFKLTRTGNPYYDYFWLYKGKLSKPDFSSDTKRETINFQAQSFKGVFQPLLANGNWRLRLRTDDANVPAATLSGFFTAVPLTAAADLGALSCVMAKATLNLTFTFAKVGAGNVTILTDTFVLGTTAIIAKSGANVAGTGAWTGQGTPSAVYTFIPTVAFGANDVAVAVTREVRDSSGVACTPAGIVLAY